MKMPTGPVGVPGEILRTCDRGVGNITGVRCYPGWHQQGNDCARDQFAPTGTNNKDSCLFYNLEEMGTRWEDMPADSSNFVPGTVQLTCVNGTVVRDTACYPGWHKSGDSCERDSGGGQTSDPNNNQPVGGMPPFGGAPGYSLPTINQAGQILGVVVPAVVDLVRSLFNIGQFILPNVQPQLSPSGVTVNGVLLVTPSGGHIVWNSVTDMLVDSKSGQLVTVNGHPVRLLPNSNGALADKTSGSLVTSASQLLVGGSPVQSRTVGLKSLPLLTGAKPGAKPGQPGSATNIRVYSQDKRPNFNKPAWLQALNNPGSGVIRPDAVNRPVDPGLGGTAPKPCYDNGTLHLNGDRWTNDIDGGKQSFECADGRIEPKGTECFDHRTLQDNRCYRWCQSGSDSATWYKHGSTYPFRLDSDKGPGTANWSCYDGQFTPAGGLRCDDGYSPGADGASCRRVYRSCNRFGTFHPHNSQWPENENGGTRTYRCDDGSVSPVSSLTCPSQTTLSSNGAQCLRWCGPEYQHGQAYSLRLRSGHGSGDFTCDNGSWNFNRINSCDAGFRSNGGDCVYAPPPPPPRKNCVVIQSSTSDGASISSAAIWYDGQVGTYNFPNGNIMAKCNDGRLVSTGLPAACKVDYEIPYVLVAGALRGWLAGAAVLAGRVDITTLRCEANLRGLNVR